MVIFWNFAGVPFVRHFPSFPYVKLTFVLSPVVHLLRRVHGFPRAREVPLLDTCLHRTLHHAAHRILHLGHLHVAEESLQDGHSRYHNISQDVPSATLWNSREPQIHSDTARVSSSCETLHIRSIISFLLVTVFSLMAGGPTRASL